MNNSLLSSCKKNIDWHQDFLSALNNEGFVFQLDKSSKFILSNYLAIKFMDIDNAFIEAKLIQREYIYQPNDIKIIYLWEDVWITKPNLVISRIKSLLGLNARIHGRKTKVIKIIKPVADLFLNENHLQGAVSSRYKFGLYLQNELIAVATFSALRKMNHTENYTSAELIRFSVKTGYSVIGGLSKVIFAFRKELNPNDVMTYADRDWSNGEAYLKLGFEHVSDLSPQHFILNSDFNRKLCKDLPNASTKVVFNSGSLKYVLKF